LLRCPELPSVTVRHTVTPVKGILGDHPGAAVRFSGVARGPRVGSLSGFIAALRLAGVMNSLPIAFVAVSGLRFPERISLSLISEILESEERLSAIASARRSLLQGF